MKTFKDLQFKRHRSAYNRILADEYKDAKHATMYFPNGYGISVLLGKMFYSNGVNTYEVAILRDGGICYTTNITNDVLGGQTEEMVTKIMEDIQNLV